MAMFTALAPLNGPVTALRLPDMLLALTAELVPVVEASINVVKGVPGSVTETMLAWPSPVVVTGVTRIMVA